MKMLKCLVLLVGVLSVFSAFGTPQPNGKPMTVNILDDHQALIALSNKDINRIFVANDKITRFNVPNNHLIAHNDESGSVFVNLTGGGAFIAFISTAKGHHFSLRITPTAQAGVTLKLIPRSPVAGQYKNHTLQAKRFETSSPYEKTLVNLLSAVMRGDTPPGYSSVAPIGFNKIAIGHIKKHPKGWRGLSEEVEALFLGGELAVRVLHITNHSRHALLLVASDFYSPGVRAVSIAQERLHHRQSTRVYEVISNV